MYRSVGLFAAACSDTSFYYNFDALRCRPTPAQDRPKTGGSAKADQATFDNLLPRGPMGNKTPISDRASPRDNILKTETVSLDKTLPVHINPPPDGIPTASDDPAITEAVSALPIGHNTVVPVAESARPGSAPARKKIHTVEMIHSGCSPTGKQTLAIYGTPPQGSK
ncbi:hypothetical protein BCR34DRAFT_586532 [Clohesyomyces aquaticus]|uniref:Uncharacterized protein n=1 Tax=Clohesyomyces aquaticus TaxID=1231657 RepID=A0A1Y1ZSZ8_9PLEO|nr:hypothetical protein BCR34DRAFT_586532 [Clohesyomyces aquaticus]